MSRKIISSVAANFGLVARQINANAKAVSLIKQSGVIPGGFPYCAFNGGAKVKPEMILSMIENTRALVFNKMRQGDSSYLYADKMYEDYFLFIMASSTQISDKLYDVDICKGPLVFDVELDHIGKTSTVLKTDISVEGISDPLIVSRVTNVLVCNKTRQPKPPPDWWMEEYAPLMDKNKKTMGKVDFLRGDNSQMTESHSKISFSDVDAYRHTNWSTYIQFCQEAFGHHQISRLGNSGYNEYFSRCVKDFSILYRKETTVGDVLTVKVTPEKSSQMNNTFYFSIENESGDIVCQSKIEYYPSME